LFSTAASILTKASEEMVVDLALLSYRKIVVFYPSVRVASDFF